MFCLIAWEHWDFVLCTGTHLLIPPQPPKPALFPACRSHGRAALLHLTVTRIITGSANECGWLAAKEMQRWLLKAHSARCLASEMKPCVELQCLHAGISSHHHWPSEQKQTRYSRRGPPSQNLILGGVSFPWAPSFQGSGHVPPSAAAPVLSQGRTWFMPSPPLLKIRLQGTGCISEWVNNCLPITVVGSIPQDSFTWSLPC